jgi:amidase
MSRPIAKVRRPDKEDIKKLADSLYIKLSEGELREIEAASNNLLKAFDSVDELEEPLLECEFNDRQIIYVQEEDKHNSFITRCLVRGVSSGRLLGKKVGIKDSISVRGIPLTNGSRLCQGYVPSIDATVVTKLLREGAIIVGKTNMDDFSFAGTSETSFYGPVRNPINPDFSAGGSSSGSAAAVASGEIDIGIAVDQGGSARIPASWCGVVAIKPTHGLVSTFGITYMDHTIDHVCPITRTIGELAEVLEVIAGYDPNDPQWLREPVTVDQYTKYLGEDVSKLRVGLLVEGFSWPECDRNVNNAVRGAVENLTKLGIDIENVSIPMFLKAPEIWTVIIITSATAMLESNGEGYWHGGYYNTGWVSFLGAARKARSSDLPPFLKTSMIIGKYMREEYFGVHHAKAQNLRRMLSAQVDRVLDYCDAIALPVTPITPIKLAGELNYAEALWRGTMLVKNCCPFNLTGHPSLAIPCASIEGLPVGLQLVSRRWNEKVLFMLGYAFERTFNWKTMRI